MAIDSYGFIEHFDYMCKYIPQPFFIKSEDVQELKYDDELQDYVIKTTRNTYDVPRNVLKKLVDALGVKVKLLAASADDEADVIDMILPVINKLFKCFADCFVFYARSDDALTIIDLNVNAVKGAEGTKYENGPSPWKIDIKKHPESFTCFSDFMSRWCMNTADTTLQVKADNLMTNNTQVVMTLFRQCNELLVPMLVFSSKFSNMSGFTEVHPMLHDTATGIEITFPMNYGGHEFTFEEVWSKLNHVYETTDVNDYIFREVNELAASNDAPNAVKNFISGIIVDSTLNLNQPVRNILDDAVTVAAQMKAGKKKKFIQQLGALVGWCFCMKHAACSSCGHLDSHAM